MRIRLSNNLFFIYLMLISGTVFAGQTNLVIFYVDDLGYGDLGSYGHPIVKTPNIDRLANEGVKFTQFYAPAPLCSPSRAGVLTGRTPYRTGIRSWIPDGEDIHIGENEITIANLLQAKGYETAVMGKLHLNGGAQMSKHPQPEDMGFDYSFVIHGGWAKNSKIETPTIDGSLRSGKLFPDNYWRNGEAVGKTDKFSAELVSDEAISWLDGLDSKKPFFLYLPYSEVHTPVASPDRYLDMYADYISDSAKTNKDVYHWDWKNLPYRGSGEYYANISFLDEQIGRVMEKLKELGKSNDTIIIFTSDNGPVTREARKPWELGMAGETGGLRGRKGNLFEGGIKVPAIIKYPEMIQARQVSDEASHGLDLLPTLAELLDFELPADRELDGQSIVPSFSGIKLVRQKPLFWTIDSPDEGPVINEWAIRVGDWKMILDRDEQAKYLFNISQDPYEMYNLLKQEPEQAQSLLIQFQKYKASIDNDAIKSARAN
ncbi:MAG: arylsulfatase A-like enzyme [Lysobacterales bacterium]|jgi:arylsulfatase A-like enzyme